MGIRPLTLPLVAFVSALCSPKVAGKEAGPRENEPDNGDCQLSRNAFLFSNPYRLDFLQTGNGYVNYWLTSICGSTVAIRIEASSPDEAMRCQRSMVWQTAAVGAH